METTGPIENFRADFPALHQTRNSLPPVYFDNACTTLVPQPVIDELTAYYTEYPACGGRRSHHWFASEVTRRVNAARERLAGFIKAESSSEIIFTLNTTQAINMVALGLPFKAGDVVLLSGEEHNSNLLPWLRLQQKGAVRVEHLSAAESEEFDLAAFEERLSRAPVRLVSLAWTSNVTGSSLPAQEIIAAAHRHGALVLLDGAQTVPHQAVDVRSLDVDFLAFSLHKMCGPRGVGVLYARNEFISAPSGSPNALEAVILGGGNAINSTFQGYQLLEGPERFEPGIPDYPGQIAAGAAVDYLEHVGMERIRKQEESLNSYLSARMQERYGHLGWLEILGPLEPERRGGILSFSVRRPNAVGIAEELDRAANIMIRDGVFCAHSYFNERYGEAWLHPKTHREHRMVYRVSLYFYNTRAECEFFLNALDAVFQERGYLE
ncbi:MAG TPA: aminotransferase class V-fold PLP-dependent enzyme [Anaerolineaceae bacterium]|nr:aminotransferase class V-fold PLP-dependent enzyme [Anaerolineaceae bacterium]